MTPRLLSAPSTADDNVPLLLAPDNDHPHDGGSDTNSKKSDTRVDGSAAKNTEKSDKPRIGIPISFMLLLFSVSAAQNMSSSLLTLLFAKTLEPQQTTYFWTFMSWIYWCAPVSGWVSDICGSRRILLLIGLLCNVISWSLITWEAGDSFAMFVVFGAIQNASMLFVNASINGALVEVVKAVNKEGSGEDDSDDDVGDQHHLHRHPSSGDSSLQEHESSLSSAPSSPSNTSNAVAAPLLHPSASAQFAEIEGENERDDNSGDQNEERQEDNILAVGNADESSDEGIKKALTKKKAKKQHQTMFSKSGDTQSTAMLARSLGSVIGAVLQTFALVKMEIRAALAISIALFCVSAVVAVFADFTKKSNVVVQSSTTESASINNDNNDNNNAAPTTATTTTTVTRISSRAKKTSLCGRVKSLFDRLRLLCDAKSGTSQRSAAVDVLLLLAFIFCNNMLPDATSFYQSYVFDAFEYPNWFNSTYQLGNLVGALIACEVYRRFLASLSQTKVFFAGCLFAATSYLTGLAFCTGFTRNTLHIDNAVYLMLDTFVVGFLNRLAFMPILHVASVRCPKGFEAVVFELFSLAAIGGSTVASLIAIRIADSLDISRTNFDKLWILMVVAASSRILPIFAVPYLPPPNENQQDEENEDEQHQQQVVDDAQ